MEQSEISHSFSSVAGRWEWRQGERDVRLLAKDGEPSLGNKYGVPPNGANISDFMEFQVNPWYRDAEFLRRKFLHEGLSTQQIADLVGSARSTVARYLRHFRIPLRSQDKARQLRKARLAYGERLQDGRIVPCKTEVEVIGMVRKLRSQGMGYQAIADFLISMRIPTKTRQAQWKPATVWNLLND